MEGRAKQSIEVEAAVTKVYEYWSNLENLPRFMEDVEEVRPTGPDTAHWVVKGPLGYRAEFDARTIRDESNGAVGWNAIGEEAAGLAGEARFEEVAPGRTRVEVTVDAPDRGPDGFAWGSGDATGEADEAPGPEETLRADLERFAEIVEGADPVAWAGRERSRRDSRWAFDAAPAEPPTAPGTDFNGAILLLESWEADESSDDEEVLAELKEGLDRDRTSHRKLFPDG